MIVSKTKFIELYKLRNETDNCDYKKELRIETKKEKFNLIKDFLAFSNYGGGYILIGVDETNYTLNAVKKIDPASLGDIIETNLGFNIKFKISYFEIKEPNSILVGLLYIYPSTRIITSPKFFQVENKTIIGINDILTRRNTKSTKANSEDIDVISKRLKLNLTNNKKSENDFINIYENPSQQVKNLWSAIENKFEFNSEQTSINIRTLLFYSKHNKIDFAKLAGINSDKFEIILKGEILPSLGELYRISRLSNIDISFFFRPNINGNRPFWMSDLVRFTILKRVNPISAISKVNDLNAFFGTIVYETAKNINELHRLLIKQENNQTLKEIPKNKQSDFIAELRLQYYKVLEQVSKNKNLGFTEQEEIILLWQYSNEDYLSRIFTESIKEIIIDNQNNYNIKFHFWEEIASKEIKGREYNGIDKELIFSKTKIKI